MFNELFWMAAAGAGQGTGGDSGFGYFILIWGILCITMGLYFGIKYRGKGYKVFFVHLTGLPFPNVKCRIRIRDGALVFDHGAVNVALPMKQIMDMNVTEKEHHRTQVVSDSGAAIGGAMDFGSWGAYAGGSPKVKEFKTYSYVLFITYRNNEGEIKQILFDVLKSPSKARQLVRKCKKYYTPQKVNYKL